MKYLLRIRDNLPLQTTAASVRILSKYGSWGEEAFSGAWFEPNKDLIKEEIEKLLEDLGFIVVSREEEE